MFQRYYREEMVPYIISCEDLKEKIDKGETTDIVIADVSWASARNCKEEYEKEHIPGAVYMSLLDNEHSKLFPRNIPEERTFEKLAQTAGICKDSHVILYSSGDMAGYFISGRSWWTCKLFGLEKVSVLDGGIEQWKKKGFPVTDEPSHPKPGNFKAKRNEMYIRTYDDLQRNMKSSEFQVCDSRTPQLYKGEAENAGHIKGAQNLLAKDLINMENGTLKSVEEMKTAFENAGVKLDQPLVTYCNSGMSSCTLAMAAMMCGNKDTAVFHGGFTEWSNKAPSDLIEK